MGTYCAPIEKNRYLAQFDSWKFFLFKCLNEVVLGILIIIVGAPLDLIILLVWVIPEVSCTVAHKVNGLLQMQWRCIGTGGQKLRYGGRKILINDICTF